MFDLSLDLLNEISVIVEENWINGNRKDSLSMLWFLNSIQAIHVILHLDPKYQKEILYSNLFLYIMNVTTREQLEKELEYHNVEGAYLTLESIANGDDDEEV